MLDHAVAMLLFFLRLYITVTCLYINMCAVFPHLLPFAGSCYCNVVVVFFFFFLMLIHAIAILFFLPTAVHIYSIPYTFRGQGTGGGRGVRQQY